MARNVIALLGDPYVDESLPAGEAITPGHLVIRSATNVLKNTANAANVARAVALERDELGKDYTDVYASGDNVKVGVFAPGMRAYMIIPSGQTITMGDYLTGDAAGRLVAAGANPRLAMALETLGAVTADTRCRVEIV